MAHAHCICYVLSHLTIAVERVDTVAHLLRSEVYVCDVCGHPWGGILHVCEEDDECHRRFAAVTKTCSLHGGGSFLKPHEWIHEADSILDEIPKELILHELRVWNHA